MNKHLLINQDLKVLRQEILNIKKQQFTRLVEQCKWSEQQKLDKEHPPTSITYMGMAAANLSLAYLLTKQEHYLEEAKRWIFTACGYPQWGYGFLVDVDLSASWLLFGFGLSYDWIKKDLTDNEKKLMLDKLILQGNRIFDYAQENKGNCWSTDYWQNHNWINYTGLLTTAYAIRDEYEEAQIWIDEIKDNFEKVFNWMPEDGSNYEGTGYWRYAINFFLATAELLRDKEGINYFESEFLKNTFYFRLYQSAPNWEENINFGDVHDRRSSHSISSYYKIASEYNNGHAQWLAELVRKHYLFREAYQSKIFPGIMPEAFLELIWYNPDIGEVSPEDLPLTRYWPDLGLVVMRSGWDRDAIHFSFKSSPAGGHKQWKNSWELDIKNGWRTRSLTHYHVDFNSFILMAYDTTLAVDEGFHRTSRARVHNMITVDNTGCCGEKIWDEGTLEDPVLFDLNCKGIYNVWRDVPKEAIAQIEDYISENGYTYTIGESSKMYYPEMRLTRNARHVFYSEMGYFIMLDELKSDLEHTYTWRLHSERFAKEVRDGVFEIVNGQGALNIYSVYPKEIKKDVSETIVQEIMTPQRPDDIREIKLKTILLENEKKEKNIYFLNILAPRSGFSDEFINAKPIESNGLIGVEIIGKESKEIFIFSENNNIEYEGIKSDAKWISIISDNHRIIKHAVYDGTYLEVNGEVVLNNVQRGNHFKKV